MFRRSQITLWITLAILVAGGMAGSVLAEQQTASTQGASTPATAPGQKIEAISEEVLLDMVVRDKKGRPVTDLESNEVEVSEDGQKRDITAFRFVEGDVAPLPTGGTAAEAIPDPLR